MACFLTGSIQNHFKKYESKSKKLSLNQNLENCCRSCAASYHFPAVLTLHRITLLQ